MRFDGAIFNDVYVNGASFRNTSFDLSKDRTENERSGRISDHGFSGELMNSCLYRSYWTGKLDSAVFFNNSFRDAVFREVEMDKVFFTSSDLQGASFRIPDFDTVYFTLSDLRNALFESVNARLFVRCAPCRAMRFGLPLSDAASLHVHRGYVGPLRII